MSRKYAAGELDRICTLESCQWSNVGSQAKRQFVTIATVRCKYMPQSGNEAYQVQETTATADVNFIIRWSQDVKGLKQQDQVLFTGSDGIQRIYDILAVAEVDRRVMLMLRTRLRNPNAS